MRLSDFDYHLPQQLIAQKPISPRDHSRLMVLDKNKKTISHRHFFNLPDYLRKGDVLVLNNTKVFPARLIGKRKDTGGKVEIFLLKLKAPASASFFAKASEDKKALAGRQNSLSSGARRAEGEKLKTEVWEVLIGNRRKKAGQIIQFGKGLECQIVKQIDQSVWEARFNQSGNSFNKLVEAIGQAPLPPYIKSVERQTSLKKQYQTIYAKERGSVAAPTAGFHFTKKLLVKLKSRGVQIEYITLHVGLGTFQAVKENNILNHQMHAEWACLDKQTARRLNKAKQEGRRIIAVGTTSLRTLESFVKNHKLTAGNCWTNIFIYPGYKFKFIDALITNFHLPASTLLMLVSALAGRHYVLRAYREAIKKKYRFYSFGDAMFVV